MEELIALRLPSEDHQRTLATFIGWARYGDLFAYDELEGTVSAQ